MSEQSDANRRRRRELEKAVLKSQTSNQISKRRLASKKAMNNTFKALQNKIIELRQMEANKEVALENETSDTEELFTETEIHGSKFVDGLYMFHELQKFSQHSSKEYCGIKYLKLTGVKRRGLKTTVQVKCTMCQYTTEIKSEPDRVDKMDLNEAAVAGTICTGGGFAQLHDFLSAVNVPCMKKHEYKNQRDRIMNYLINTAENKMKAAAEEEKLLAIQRGDILPVSGLPRIPVIANGSWLKRSYRKFNSVSGIGVIVGYYTKKVLFTGIRNKTCSICRVAAKKKQRPRSHMCFKNFPSSAMESNVILEGFRRSMEKQGLVYSKLIVDDDSAAYKKILDADPYEIPVEKMECTDDLLRNFGRKLKEVAKKAPSGRLRKVVEYNVRRMRVDILKAAKFRDEQNRTTSEKIKLFYADLLNIPKHAYGDHSECVNLGGFCDGSRRKNEKNMVSELMEKGMFQEVQEIMQSLFVHLENLLYDRNNNMMEGFINVIAKYIGGKRVYLGDRESYVAKCALAVIEFNTDEALPRLAVSMNKEPSNVLKNVKRKRQNQSNAQKLRAKSFKRELEQDQNVMLWQCTISH